MKTLLKNESINIKKRGKVSKCSKALVALLLAHKHEDTVVINKGFY